MVYQATHNPKPLTFNNTAGLPVEQRCECQHQTLRQLMNRQASSHIPPTAVHCTLAYDLPPHSHH